MSSMKIGNLKGFLKRQNFRNRRGEIHEKENIMIDPVVRSVGIKHMAAVKTLDMIKLVYKELEVNICVGSSNFSFGLPDRRSINFSFLCLSKRVFGRLL